MNPLAMKSIPNVLSEIPALRFGCQQLFVHGPRTREVTIDIAFLESQVQLLCADPIRYGSEHARLQRHPFHCIPALIRSVQLFQIDFQSPSQFNIGNGSRIDAVAQTLTVNLPLRFRLQGVNPCHPYLAERGITSATARDFGTGFFAGPGLMSGRNVFPIHDELGRIVAYGGRSLEGQAPRYRLPAGFRKSAVLFNLHRAAASGCDEAIVVEGFFDCMKVHQAGFASVVALMGTTLSAQQQTLLVDRFRGLVLLLDGDAAGQRGATAIATQLSGACHVEVVELHAGVQPDQLSNSEIRQLLGHRQAYGRNLATLYLREIPISLGNRPGQNAAEQASEASPGTKLTAELDSQRKEMDLPKQSEAGYNKVSPE